MLGAGVFAVWSPLLEVDGTSLIWAVAVAGAIATINALSTAQLAAAHPVAGGAYTFGVRELGPLTGFVAGAAFVLGKTASIAAIALTVAATLPVNLGSWWSRLLAAACVLAGWALNSRGITRTAAVASVIAITVIVTVVVTSAGAISAGGPALQHDPTVTGVLGGAALVFFAFAGYARIATLGQEVSYPSRTIPRAIVIALVITLVLYVLVAVAVSVTASSADVAAVAPWTSGSVAVRLVAAAAAFGSLVALMAGVGRTSMAMARQADLPPSLAVTNRAGVPARAEAVSALMAIALTGVGSLSFAIAVSSVAVLVYYAVANLAAVRQHRRGGTAGFSIPWQLSAVGVVVCVALVASLPWLAVAVAGVGIGGLVAVRRLTQR
jgi:APA family basic amino acid/polyamine antiporter